MFCSKQLKEAQSSTIRMRRRRCSEYTIDDDAENSYNPSSIRRSSSVPDFKRQKLQHIMSSLPQRMQAAAASSSSTYAVCNPHQAMLDILSKQGKDPTTRPSLEINNFFIEYTEEQIEAYDMDVIRAVRSQDIPQLRTIHQAGKHLQCANRFGESLIHMACRRGFVDVVRFLIEEAGVSVRVRDDYGRTALHDACWTSEPNEDLVEVLIRRCPELLLMSDKRGYAPFEYVRNEHWGRWVEFVKNNQKRIL